MRVDVVVATLFRPKLLETCLISLFNAATRANSKIQVRILVSVFCEDQESNEILDSLSKVNSSLFIYRSMEKLDGPASRNRILSQLSPDDSDWTYFIDDDAFVPEDFFLLFLKAIDREPKAAAIGGPNLTPPESSFFQNASGAALASRLACANIAKRYCQAEYQNGCSDDSLILCNLAVRSHLIIPIQFPEFLRCNEENWVLQDLQSLNLILVYDPHLYVWHMRRTTLSQFWKQIVRYGHGRGQTIRLRPATTRWFHLVPSACLIFTLFTVLVLPMTLNAMILWAILCIIYILLLIFEVAHLALSRKQFNLKMAEAILGGLLIPIIHYAFGIGTIRGFFLRTNYNLLPLAKTPAQ